MDPVDTQVAITLRHLNEQVRTIKRLQQYLAQIIDPPLSEWINVSSIKKQTLVLIADNSSVATHVKMIAPAIVDGMNRLAPQLNVTAVSCKVKKPVYDGSALNKKSDIHLSKSAAEHIKQTASGIKHDRLREALEKLSKNGQ